MVSLSNFEDSNSSSSFNCPLPKKRMHKLPLLLINSYSGVSGVSNRRMSPVARFLVNSGDFNSLTCCGLLAINSTSRLSNTGSSLSFIPARNGSSILSGLCTLFSVVSSGFLGEVRVKLDFLVSESKKRDELGRSYD